jgi:non-ribosomal peptide synthetase component F
MAPYQAGKQLQFFADITESLLRDPRQPLSNIRSVSVAELDEIWSWTTPLAPSIDTCIHEIIYTKTQSHPEKNAIEAWDGNLTYAEVERFSTALAHHLRTLDHSADQIIPVLFEKVLALRFSILHNQKAGFAPSYNSSTPD